jgi:hypothetical protein
MQILILLHLESIQRRATPEIMSFFVVTQAVWVCLPSHSVCPPLYPLICMALLASLPAHYPLEQVGNAGEGYDTPTITFACSEAEAQAFVMRCQSLTKWNYHKRRTEVGHRNRTRRAGAWTMVL